MQVYLIFLVSLAVAGGLAWLARDLIFGRPPTEDESGDAERDR